jgi:hypothetical protein
MSLPAAVLIGFAVFLAVGLYSRWKLAIHGQFREAVNCMTATLPRYLSPAHPDLNLSSLDSQRFVVAIEYRHP